jgi:hypothetical protein
MKEYKIINLRCRFFSGTFDTNALEKELDNCSKKGWEVHSMTPDNSGTFGKSKYLILLLEREKK